MSPNIPVGFCNIRKKFGEIRELMFTKFCDISSHNVILIQTFKQIALGHFESGSKIFRRQFS